MLYVKKTSNKKRQNFLELYDVTKKEILWSVNNDNVKPLGLNSEYAYYMIFSDRTELVRHSVKKIDKVDKMFCSLFSFAAIDFYPERWLSTFIENEGLFIGEINLGSGLLSKGCGYELQAAQIPTGRMSNRSAL